MLRKTLIALLLVVSAAFSAAGNATDKIPPDELKDKAVRTARKVDHFLQRRQARQKTDTAYIFKPQERWLVRTRADISQSHVKFHSLLTDDDLGYNLDLHSIPRYKQHFGFGYRGLVLGFGIGFSRKKSDKEISIKVYENKFGGEITYRYIGSLKGKFDILGNKADIPEGDLDCHFFQFGAYYAFQGNRFSMPAAMNQAYIQRKSAGSALATTNFRVALFGMQEDKNDNSAFDTMSVFFGLGGGYGYNWVPSKHWLLHISATETLGIVGTTRFKVFGVPMKGRGRFIPLVTTGNAAVIYYYKKFYGGAFATVDNMFIPTKVKETDDRYRISTTRIEGHLTVGFRF